MKNLFNKSTEKELLETSNDLQKNIKNIDERIQEKFKLELDAKSLIEKTKAVVKGLREEITALEAEKNQAIGVKKVVDEQLESLG